jgi:hypothetical protein
MAGVGVGLGDMFIPGIDDMSVGICCGVGVGDTFILGIDIPGIEDIGVGVGCGADDDRCAPAATANIAAKHAA